MSHLLPTWRFFALLFHSCCNLLPTGWLFALPFHNCCTIDCFSHHTITFATLLTLSCAEVGGGEKHPPFHTFVIPCTEGGELLFEVSYYFRWPGGRRNGQNCPCQEQQEGKNTNQNNWPVSHVASNFLVIFLLGDHSLGEIWDWEKK